MDGSGKSKTSNQNQATIDQFWLKEDALLPLSTSRHLGKTGSSVGVGDSLADHAKAMLDIQRSTSFNPPRFRSINKNQTSINSSEQIPFDRRML